MARTPPAGSPWGQHGQDPWEATKAAYTWRLCCRETGRGRRQPITSDPLDISWENGVILSFHSWVRLRFQLPEN